MNEMQDEEIEFHATNLLLNRLCNLERFSKTDFVDILITALKLANLKPVNGSRSFHHRNVVALLEAFGKK